MKDNLQNPNLSDKLVIDQKLIKTVDLYLNSGQISGVPGNPKYIDEKGQKDLENSLKEDPEYLIARPLIVIPYADAYVVICGNARLRMCIQLFILEVPCVVLNPNTPIEKLKRYIIKDNLNYGKWDWDEIANSWETEGDEGVKHWGLELPYMGDPDPESEPPAKDEHALHILKLGFEHVQDLERFKLEIIPIINKIKGAEIKG